MMIRKKGRKEDLEYESHRSRRHRSTGITSVLSQDNRKETREVSKAHEAFGTALWCDDKDTFVNCFGV
jgi:hypothetical protein